MDPKFKCPFCGKERLYTLSPKSISVNGRIYFRLTRLSLVLNRTFCDIGCLLSYINEWCTDAESVARRWDEEMDKLEAKYD